ncbi:glycosyltransferase 87 family protein [Corynebacterium marquesiae]|uniref:glycosyltransferase 87 family protein n=1 Tax=Corynebacterium marquesiae TaxID=2913503 RepID=UPI00254A3ECB|nr:glycosyltransferase 87 family protein [Corynebacterium marquesiae]MDU7600154.1 glycosyltransferase 87 family protein [Corynebacterium sp.]MDK8455186.1 glycosyltransferase 87 family protein [Corynebacterium marquesiae]MDK8480665.1 glycosyltransferase 87 family protein [Corynebacterium marquesiae]MDK8531386.1 glycosyltransferase 87 family protein [Corynebacterium marquesiae]MDK8725369.1 glycosyltransferase 87 family protein [Corynebacterium marquesiae]
MKKLYGLPTVVTVLAALIGVIVYRFSIYDGNSAFVWRVPLDLKIYWLAGGEVAQGADLYDNAYIGDLPFTYPPFSGTLFTWLSRLADAPLILLWQGGTALSLFTVIMLVLRERGLKLSPAMWLLGFLLLCCTPANEPVHGTLFFGQINIFLMLLVALDILPRKRALLGIGIGLAAGMKLTPAYMGLVLLFQKRWWQAIIAILTFAVTVAIGFVTIPDAADFWTDAIFKSSRVGEHTNPGAQSIRSVMVRAWGIDGGWIWLAAVVVVFILTCLALRTAMKHRNNSAALALAGISSCLVSPFSWYHHWVWTVPLAVVVMVSVNQALGKRLTGFLGAQFSGLVSVLAMCAVTMPFVSAAVWLSAASRSLNHWDLQPWGMLAFTGAGVLYIAFYAVWGFIPGTQPAEETTAPGNHQQFAQPSVAQPAAAATAARRARSLSTESTTRGGQSQATHTISDETAEMPAVGPETRAFPAAQDITDIPDTPAYGRHSRSED